MSTSFEILCNDFKKLGLNDGDVVIVHSSLSSMGYVEGGAQTVIDALTEVIGKEGTLLFPAFSYSTSCPTSEFSLNETPVCIGKIAEAFRLLSDVRRSFHPTHSVCARGKYAEEFVSGHEDDITPMGVNSPYRKLPRYHGKILFLGCSVKSNSFLHAMEEVAEVPYVLGEQQIFKMTDANGNVIHKGIHRHNFKRPEGVLVQRYDRALEILDEGTDYTVGTVHGATAHLLKSDILEKKAVAKMKESPFYFIDDPDGIL